MATIKSYTDLQQAKKLAEILPLESADMEYMFLKRDSSKVSNVPFVKNDDEPEWPDDSSYSFIPCWSLAALLGVLPDHFYDKTGRKTLGMDKGDTYYKIFYENKNSYIQKSAYNPVDACVAMIEKLHELKML